MNDDQLLRYSRHILLDDVGIEGQQRLVDSHVLIVGAGGLGSPVALYLAASGVGHITIADHDTVDLTNLQRQIAHTTARVGHPKVESASQAMLALNPERVNMSKAKNFRSTSQNRAQQFAILGNGKSAKLGWQMQDYNPAGAVGNAAAATADTGRQVVEAAGRSLACLLAELDQLPMSTLVAWPD